MEKEKKVCGQRWMAETAFSSIKQMFGEYTSTTKFQLVKYMTMKIYYTICLEERHKMNEYSLRKTSYATEQSTSYIKSLSQNYLSVNDHTT
jgi:hypothetical protein